MENLTEQQKLESRKLHPVSPFIYRLLGKVVVNGVLAKKYNAHFTYVDDVAKYRGQSYIVVSNHGSRMDYVFTTAVIPAEALTFVRGRAITDTWLMIDEAQNLTPRQVKGIITRVGRGTKVILLGDPAQIDHPLLDEQSNGLSYAADRMRGSPLCVQLTMLPDECERSELALDAAMRM